MMQYVLKIRVHGVHEISLERSFCWWLGLEKLFQMLHGRTCQVDITRGEEPQVRGSRVWGVNIWDSQGL